MSHRSVLSDLDKTFLWKWLLDSKWAKKAAIIFVCWNGFHQLLLKTTLKEKEKKKTRTESSFSSLEQNINKSGISQDFAQYRT